jgi:hypothetical protein
LWSSTITLSKSSHSAITDLRPSLPDRTSGAASMYLRCVVFSSKDGALLHALVMEDWVNTVAIGLSGRFVIGGGDASCLFVQWLHDDDGGSRKNYRMEWSTSDLPASNVLALALCPSEPTLLAAGGNGCVLSLWRLEKTLGSCLPTLHRTRSQVGSCRVRSARAPPIGSSCAGLGGKGACP